MIKAYDEELFAMAAKKGNLHDFIFATTVAADPDGVRDHLTRFLLTCRPEPPVQETLSRILSDERLFARTQLVNDRSWRTCVLMVTPRRIVVTQGGITFADGTCDLNATLTYWRLHAEAFFIHLQETDPPALERTLGESMEYLLLWLFKRYFGTVLS